jgi:hypothetical protein
MMLTLCAVALATVLVFIVMGRPLSGILLVAVCAPAWRLYIWPRQKRKYLEAVDNLPSWEIEPH